jgi:hypothetical protein
MRHFRSPSWTPDGEAVQRRGVAMTGLGAGGLIGEQDVTILLASTA